MNRKPACTARVLRGLSLLAEHADAGGPDDLELDDEAHPDHWRDVQRAIEWVRAMREYKSPDAARPVPPKPERSRP